MANVNYTKVLWQCLHFCLSATGSCKCMSVSFLMEEIKKHLFLRPFVARQPPLRLHKGKEKALWQTCIFVGYKHVVVLTLSNKVLLHPEIMLFAPSKTNDLVQCLKLQNCVPDTRLFANTPLGKSRFIAFVTF